MFPVSTDIKDSNIVEANCTIDEDYSIVMGDERFYRLVGEKSMYTLYQLVHPDDRDEFELYLAAAESDKVIFIRIQLKVDKYHWFILRKVDEHNETDGRHLIELRLSDVIAQNSKFDMYTINVSKYRAMLTMFNEKVFEYDMETGIITIYFYSNGQAEILERDDLDEWQKRVLRLGYVEKTEQADFERLCSDIRNGADSFTQSFYATIFSKGARRDTLIFKGETISLGTQKKLVVGVISELGARIKQKVVQYDNDANKDSSTGILNKKAVTDDIIAVFNDEQKIKSYKKVYLVIYDIDNFKSVNDTYGHYFGDEVISSFAYELSKTIGNNGITGRIGGDEFISLLTGYDDIEDVKMMLKSIRNSLKLKLSEKKKDYYFSCSIGISEYQKDGVTYEDLFKITDGALYIAKEKGKDRYIIYDKELHGKLIGGSLECAGEKVVTEFLKPMDKCALATSLAIKTLKNGRPVAVEVLKEMVDKMNIHGISIYEGENLKCVFSLGHYQKVMENASYALRDEYRALFDKHDVNVINNIVSLAIDFIDIYEFYKEHNICSSLQIILKSDENRINSLICCDTFGEHRRKWSREDIMAVYAVVKALANV